MPAEVKRQKTSDETLGGRFSVLVNVVMNIQTEHYRALTSSIVVTSSSGKTCALKVYKIIKHFQTPKSSK